jgi:hypothetical protein
MDRSGRLPTASRRSFAGLLDQGKLIYAGRVGPGMSEKVLKDLRRVGAGFALRPGAPEAMPIDAGLAKAAEGSIEDVQWGHLLDIGMATIGVAVVADDGSAGGIAAVASVAGVDRKAGGRAPRRAGQF